MTTTTRKTPEPKLPFEVTDIDALQASRPELVSEETVHRVVTIRGQEVSNTTTSRKFVAKSEQPLLYQLVKLNHRLKVETPGITVGGQTTTTGPADGVNLTGVAE